MKNHWIRIAAISVALLGLAACGLDRSDSAESQIHVETPFGIAMAGSRATLDFAATAGQVKAGKNHMLSLTFDRTEAADPTHGFSSRPPRTLLPFKVRVVRLNDDGTEVPVALTSSSDDLGKIDPARYPDYIAEDPAADIYYAFHYGIGSSPAGVRQGYLRLVSFELTQPGRYRAEAETLQDKPMFANVPSVLSVQRQFNAAK